MTCVHQGEVRLGVQVDPQRDGTRVRWEVLQRSSHQRERRCSQRDWADELPPSHQAGSVSGSVWPQAWDGHGDGVVSTAAFRLSARSECTPGVSVVLSAASQEGSCSNVSLMTTSSTQSPRACATCSRSWRGSPTCTSRTSSTWTWNLKTSCVSTPPAPPWRSSTLD